MYLLGYMDPTLPCAQVSTGSQMWLDMQRDLRAACKNPTSSHQASEQAQQQLCACRDKWHASGASLRAVPNFIAEGVNGLMSGRHQSPRG